MNGDIVRIEHRGNAYRSRPGARVVLMTATVSPPAAAVARSDPNVRVRDYSKALDFDLSLPSSQFDRIVLADNSASDLTPIFASLSNLCSDKAIELLELSGKRSFACNGQGVWRISAARHGANAFAANRAPRQGLENHRAAPLPKLGTSGPRHRRRRRSRLPICITCPSLAQASELAAK